MVFSKLLFVFLYEIILSFLKKLYSTAIYQVCGYILTLINAMNQIDNDDTGQYEVLVVDMHLALDKLGIKRFVSLI